MALKIYTNISSSFTINLNEDNPDAPKYRSVPYGHMILLDNTKNSGTGYIMWEAGLIAETPGVIPGSPMATIVANAANEGNVYNPQEVDILNTPESKEIKEDKKIKVKVEDEKSKAEVTVEEDKIELKVEDKKDKIEKRKNRRNKTDKE